MPAATFPPQRLRQFRAPPFRVNRVKARAGKEVGDQGKTEGVMAAQIPILATTSTPGIVRNSKKRPASPSHNSSSGGGYGSSKKKKVCASSFAQVRTRNGTGRGGAEPGRLRNGGRCPCRLRCV
ncbi:hypothetical protein P7K49_028188 [Saguinus oedipus]|uniref:Uncharacterized protein n=1 Tax=Saguinus oedipus TaxID=9490 RepID=A0ABQ9UCE3_SAGOE|nr:hypothetical protein P7K49_028188 [Saguinus oedipus]